MKRVIVCLVVISSLMIVLSKKETVPLKSENAFTVSWLRDSQTAKRHAEIKAGSFFVAERNTVYGADCAGCTVQDGVASTSSQIKVSTDSVQQSDGTWKKGITYDGYYLIAADKALPMCTVVRISGHSYSGAGIEEGVPFLAIVADRGSMIENQSIDLFAGSEKHSLAVHKKTSGAVVELIGFLKHVRNENGQMVCAGE